MGKPVAANQRGISDRSGGRGRASRAHYGATRSATAQQYWERIEGVYMTGDAARRDEDGYYWILGRVDDVMNVSGHRLSTMEVESALVRHPAVAEAAVVGKPHEITGQAVACFVTLKKGNWDHEQLAEELRQWVAHEIGGFARPEQIRFTDALPKTRSGKIMRRLLREIVTSNSVTGDVTTLEDLPWSRGSLRSTTKTEQRESLLITHWRGACVSPVGGKQSMFRRGLATCIFISAERPGRRHLCARWTAAGGGGKRPRLGPV